MSRVRLFHEISTSLPHFLLAQNYPDHMLLKIIKSFFSIFAKNCCVYSNISSFFSRSLPENYKRKLNLPVGFKLLIFLSNSYCLPQVGIL